jgi:hypothetical protein
MSSENFVNQAARAACESGDCRCLVYIIKNETVPVQLNGLSNYTLYFIGSLQWEKIATLRFILQRPNARMILARIFTAERFVSLSIYDDDKYYRGMLE